MIPVFLLGVGVGLFGAGLHSIRRDVAEKYGRADGRRLARGHLTPEQMARLAEMARNGRRSD